MNEENVRMMCPNLKCRSILNVPTKARGKIVRCSRCGFRMKVPAAKGIEPAEAQPAPAENL